MDFWQASWEEMDGQKDDETTGRLMRRGHTLENDRHHSCPSGRERTFSFSLSGSESVTELESLQLCEINPALHRGCEFFFRVCVLPRGAMMRTGTAQGAAWSFPPPTCTSWRAESLPTTGPYLTRGRNLWASVSSRPPASPVTVRFCLRVWRTIVF